MTGSTAAPVPPQVPLPVPAPVLPPVPAPVLPPPRPLFDRWPGPAEPASDELLGTIAAVGVVTAAALPEAPTGVGWLFAAAVAAGMTMMVAWGASRAGDMPPLRPISAADGAWTTAAIALAAVGTVRAAEWLAVLCLLAAATAASLAVAGRSFRSLTMSLSALAVAALRSVPWIARGLRGGRRRPLLRAGAAALVGVLLLAVFVPLLASADAAFSQVVSALTPAVDGSSVVRWVVLFGLGAAGTAGACFLLLSPPPRPGPGPRATRLRCLDWAIPTGLLVAVFALFVGVQFLVLFGSDGYVLRTTGLTYAEYARGGFWQLLAVTALAFGVLSACSRWAPAHTAVDRGVKRGLLAALAVLTLVIVASAISRMWLYQQAYGFTVLRVLVLTCELWLGAGFLTALVAVLRLRPGGLSRPMLALGMLALLGLAVLDPERFIAQQNVARWAETGKLDAHYLETLSADAVPALVDLPEPARSCVLAAIAGTLAEPDDWRATNVSREAARTMLAGFSPSCP